MNIPHNTNHKIIILSYSELQAPHRVCMWRTQNKKDPVCFNIPYAHSIIWWARYNGAPWDKTNGKYLIKKVTGHHLVSAHIIVKTKSSRKLKFWKQNFRDQYVNKIWCKNQSIRKPLAIILKICKKRILTVMRFKEISCVYHRNPYMWWVPCVPSEVVLQSTFPVPNSCQVKVPACRFSSIGR